MLSVTISRSLLSLSDLTIDGNPNEGSLFLAEEGNEEPTFAMRRNYAPESPFIPGRVLLAAVRDSGSMPLRVYAQGNSAVEVRTAMDELEDALEQFTYTLTLTVDGVSRSWAADPEIPQWGELDSGLVTAYMRIATVAVPLQRRVA